MSLLSVNNAVVHVEVACVGKCHLNTLRKVLEEPLKNYLVSRSPIALRQPLQIDETALSESSDLSAVESLVLDCDAKTEEASIGANDLHDVMYHMYIPNHREMELEMFEIQGDGEAEGGVPSSSHWLLPSNSFLSLWENLIYDDDMKTKLLKFALSALTFSQHSVNQNIISCNRLILLHGPPGTGKTSLCKALAQKLAIRTQRSYRHTHLIEINSHSLFSKWFSESGKLVMRLFGQIREIVADRDNLVCVLIDEVESIAYARDCMSGQEPKDAMRVVNALLTQLDSIKEHPNVLILATSNLADTIDLAFLDRADIKQYIGLPSINAIRTIYSSMLLELMRVGLVHKESLTEEIKHEGLLTVLSERSVGLSGRTLRKLPFLAHAIHTGCDQFGAEEKIRLSDFLDAMLIALDKHRKDNELMKK